MSNFRVWSVPHELLKTTSFNVHLIDENDRWKFPCSQILIPSLNEYI